MDFISPVFFIFLVPFLLVSVPLRKSKYRPTYIFFLILSSLVFYGWGSPVRLLLLFWVTGLAWSGGLFLYNRLKARSLAFAIFALILAPLLVLKYGDFTARNLALLLRFPSDSTGTGSFLALVFPVMVPGISFYTFQGLSYLTEIRRRQIKKIANPAQFLLYISFFPQLVAGPIVMAHRFFPRLHHGTLRFDLRGGAYLLVSGYFKKVILADRLSVIASGIFDGGTGTTGDAWVALLAYSFQIYFDFSGYSDIALGLGRLIGFRLPENFNFPYGASGFQDFWRRWHMTLSGWLRDHIYIPLGGSRLGFFRMQVALFTTMLVGGLWHGAGWNFILWGAGHGFLLALERSHPVFQFLKGRFAYRLVVFLLVTLLWVPFRTGGFPDSFDGMVRVYGMLFAWDGWPVDGFGLRFLLLTMLSYLLAFVLKSRLERLPLLVRSLPDGIFGLAAGMATFLLILFSGRGSNFIYFVF